MRGSILVTFDELVDDRGVDSFQVLVNQLTRDIHYVDVNNYYSTYCFPNDVIRIILNFSSNVIPDYNIIRRDYTTDSEGGDNGIKETSITPTILVDSSTVLTLQFTATTRPDAYNFHYIVNASTEECFSIGSGFTSSGVETPQIRDIDILSTGRLLIGGEFTNYSGISSNRIIELNTNGTKYTSFDYGIGFTADTTNSVIEQSNGNLVVVGQFTDYNTTPVLRIVGIKPDGSVNTSFTVGTGFNNDPIIIEQQSDGKLLVGGIFSSYNGTSSKNLIRLNADGTVDSSFNVGTGFTWSFGTSSIVELKIQSDGKIICSGKFDEYNGTTGLNKLIRLNSDGSIDNTFNTGTGLDNDAEEIRIQSDGKILLCGYFTSYNGVSQNYITRLNSDGTIDTSFSGLTTGFNNPCEAMELLSDGRILVGGAFSAYNGVGSRNHIICLNTDGSINSSTTFGSGFNSTVSAIAVDNDDNIYVGGIFTTYKGVTYNRLIKLNEFGNELMC